MDYKNPDDDDSATELPNAPKGPISFAGDIAIMFTAKDKKCMADRGVNLDDYGYMSDPGADDKYAEHANANHVYARLTGDEKPQMPIGGEKKWTAMDNPEGQKNLKTFRDWMTVDPTYQP